MINLKKVKYFKDTIKKKITMNNSFKLNKLIQAKSNKSGIAFRRNNSHYYKWDRRARLYWKQIKASDVKWIEKLQTYNDLIKFNKLFNLNVYGYFKCFNSLKIKLFTSWEAKNINTVSEYQKKIISSKPIISDFKFFCLKHIKYILQIKKFLYAYIMRYFKYSIKVLNIRTNRQIIKWNNNLSARLNWKHNCYKDKIIRIFLLMKKSSTAVQTLSLFWGLKPVFQSLFKYKTNSLSSKLDKLIKFNNFINKQTFKTFKHQYLELTRHKFTYKNYKSIPGIRAYISKVYTNIYRFSNKINPRKLYLTKLYNKY